VLLWWYDSIDTALQSELAVDDGQSSSLELVISATTNAAAPDGVVYFRKAEDVAGLLWYYRDNHKALWRFRTAKGLHRHRVGRNSPTHPVYMFKTVY